MEIGSVISEAIQNTILIMKKIKRYNRKIFEKTSGGLARLDQQLVQTGNEFTDFCDENGSDFGKRTITKSTRITTSNNNSNNQ